MIAHPNRLPGEKLDPVASGVFLLVHLLPVLAIFTGVGWHDWQILLVTYWGRMFFITGGYHRYFAHRSYKTSRVFQFILALGGTMATQNKMKMRKNRLCISPWSRRARNPRRVRS